MFYVLAMATILSSIFIYALYPRSDGVYTMDIPAAKAPAVELLTQHMAALTAAKTLVEDDNGKTVMQYNNWLKTDSLELSLDKFKAHLEGSVYQHNKSFSYIQSKIYIVNNKTGTLLKNTADTKETFPTPLEDGTYTIDYGTSDYLITYVSFQSLASVHGDLSARLTARALGEMSNFREYETPALRKNADPTYVTASTFCGGILEGGLEGGDFDPFSDAKMYLLSDSRNKLVSLPRVFTNELEKQEKNPTEYFACITRLKAKHLPILDCSVYKDDTKCNRKFQCQWHNGACEDSENNYGILYPATGTETQNNGGTQND